MTIMVNPDMIRLARESRGLTQKEVAEMLHISQGNVSKLENGTIVDIASDLLINISKALDYPDDFFLLRDNIYGPGLAFIYHRSRRSLPKKTAEKIEALIQIHRLVISRLLKSVEYEVGFPIYDIDESSPEDIARAVRVAWLLPRGPIKDVIQLIEKNGGIVIPCEFGTPKIDALSQSIPGLPPLFFINKNIPCDRLRHSLCHEIGHVVMHRIPRPEADIEQEADNFASELLMPASEIGPSLHNVKLHILAQLKPYWKTSMASILLRASRLNKITKNQERYLWMQMAPYRHREPAELDIPLEEPKALRRLIDIHLKDYSYSLPQLSKIVNLHAHEFRANYLGEERHLKLVKS